MLFQNEKCGISFLTNLRFFDIRGSFPLHGSGQTSSVSITEGNFLLLPLLFLLLRSFSFGEKQKPIAIMHSQWYACSFDCGTGASSDDDFLVGMYASRFFFRSLKFFRRSPEYILKSWISWWLLNLLRRNPKEWISILGDWILQFFVELDSGLQSFLGKQWCRCIFIDFS